MGTKSRSIARQKRKKRVRKTVIGTSERPRLSIFRSLKHIYAQIIDDSSAITLIDASSLSKGTMNEIGNQGGNIKGASLIGESIAKKALDKGIKKVVFDRNGFLYHGRVKALAESARKSGLDF